MANSLLTPTEITREFLDILHSNIVICKNMDRQYESKFANSGVSLSGNKIGPNLRIRKPNVYNVRSSWPMAQQDITEAYETLTIDTVRGIDMNFDDSALTLTIDDFSQRYIEPAAKRLAAELDYVAGAYIVNNTYNAVGEISTTYYTPGSNSKPTTFLNAIKRVKENLAPMDDGICAIISPTTEASVVSGLSGLYNPQNAISGQYEEGQMSRALGAKWYMSQLLSSHVNGTRTDTSPITSAAPALGATSIVVTGAGNSLTYTVGDTFSVSGIYEVNPESKQQYATLKQFVCTSAVTSAANGSVTLYVAPAIYTSGPMQNCTAFGTTSRALYNITIANGYPSGPASSTMPVDIVMHEKSFALATVDLELPRGLDMAARASSDGISIRFLRGYDILNARMLSRCDIYFGICKLRPEWACKVWGAAA